MTHRPALFPSHCVLLLQHMVSHSLRFYGGSETNPILAHGETGAGQQAWLKAADLECPTDQGREKTGPVSGEEKRRGTEACFSSKGRH